MEIYLQRSDDACTSMLTLGKYISVQNWRFLCARFLSLHKRCHTTVFSPENAHKLIQSTAQVTKGLFLFLCNQSTKKQCSKMANPVSYCSQNVMGLLYSLLIRKVILLLITLLSYPLKSACDTFSVNHLERNS